jgi:DNA polymerase III alpha subunit (gram-positive type)
MEAIRNLQTIMRHWFGPYPPGVPPVLWDHYPENYLYIDTETTGKDFGIDLITEVGWAIIRNRQVVDYGGQLLNWAAVLPANQWSWVVNRIGETQQAMQEKGRAFHVTPELLLTEGVNPYHALDIYSQIIQDAVYNDQLILGHNAWFFDWHMIDSNLNRFLGQRIPWHANAIVDTGLIERAAQMGRLPWPGDTLDRWQFRASQYPYYTKWNLDDHCLRKYRLAERFGLDVGQFHRTGYDCIAGHLLFETYREIAEGRYWDPAWNFE